MVELERALRPLLSDPSLAPAPIEAIAARVAGRRRRAVRRRASTAVIVSLAVVGCFGAVLAGRDGSVVITAARPPVSSDVAAPPRGPSGSALRVTYVPAGYELVDDGEAGNPWGQRVRTLRYAKPGDPPSAHMFVQRLVGAPEDIPVDGSALGGELTDVGPHQATLTQTGGRVSVRWTPVPSVSLSVHGGSGLSQPEVLLVARGIVYDSSSDDLRTGVRSDPLDSAAVVAEGELEGARWQLSVYDSDSGLCVHLKYRTSSGASCGHGIGPDQPIGGGPSGGASGVGSGWQFASGAVRKDVALVRVELDNGDAISVSPVGGDKDFEENFFATPVPPTATVIRLVALDGAGSQLGELLVRPVPPRPR